MIKLFMNSNSGKMTQKEHKYTYDLIDKSEYETYAIKNFNFICKNGLIEIGDKILVKRMKEVTRSWSYTHVGAIILSYARRMLY